MNEKANTQSQKFRATRYGPTQIESSISIQWLGKKFTVKNWSRTGVAFDCDKSSLDVKLGKKISDVKIYFGDTKLFDGTIEIKNKNEDGALVCYGASFTSSLFLIEHVDTLKSIEGARSQIGKLRQQMESVNPEICKALVQLSWFFNVFKGTCEQEENRWRKMTFDQRCESEQVFLPNMTKLLSEVLTKFNVEISGAIDLGTLPQDSVYNQIFEKEIYPYFKHSDLGRRAYEKPRGYAGDYEMMNQMYRNSYEGEDLFGKVVHNYILNEACAMSVKFRRPFFYNFFQELLNKKGQLTTLSVACGPAIEVQDVVKNWTKEQLSRIDMTLFDLDREALEHAQSKIYEISLSDGKELNINFVNKSIKSFLSKSLDDKDQYDLIYSGGLFDYFDNMTSKVLVQKLATMIKPSGKLIIGNFTKDDPSRAFCHLVTNWPLLHKTEEEMLAWAEGLIDYKMSVQYDDGKINAFLILERNA